MPWRARWGHSYDGTINCATYWDDGPLRAGSGPRPHREWIYVPYDEWNGRRRAVTNMMTGTTLPEIPTEMQKLVDKHRGDGARRGAETRRRNAERRLEELEERAAEAAAIDRSDVHQLPSRGFDAVFDKYRRLVEELSEDEDLAA